MKKCNLFTVTILFIILFMALLPTQAKAAGTFITYDNLTFITIDENSVALTRQDRTLSGEIIIPSTVNGYTVTHIDPNAFETCSNITSIILPDTITTIGEFAFAKCSSLTSIILPDSITTIDRYAFYNCSNLSSIVLSDSLVAIEAATFKGCTNLTSITLPDSITKIGMRAFADCTYLTSINIPESVTEIASIPFEHCSNLKKVYITDIESWCNIKFEEPYSSNPLAYASILYINDEIAKNIIIPEGVTQINENLFKNCKTIESVTLPNTVTKICAGAFENCNALTSINIPNSVTEIEYDAFYNCPNLNSVYIDSLENWCNITFGAYKANTSYNSLASANPMSYGADLYINNVLTNNIVIPDSINQIKDYTFCGFNGTSIVLPDSITTIGEAVFCACKNLETIKLPNALTSVGNSAFGGCKSLKSINIPDSITTIGDYAFRQCDTLEYIKLPSSIKSLSAYSLAECDNLHTVIINFDPLYIKENAFYRMRTNAHIVITSDTDFIEADLFDTDSILFGKAGSVVEEYAADNNMKFYKLPESICVSELPAITDYRYTDNTYSYLDTTGLNLTVKYYDGTEETISTDYFVSEFDITKIGEQEITVYFGGATTTFNVTVSSFDYGDANDDGKINVMDAVLIKKHIAGFENLTINTDACDVNVDTRINVMDAVMVLKYIAGFDVTLGK